MCSQFPVFEARSSHYFYRKFVANRFNINQCGQSITQLENKKWLRKKKDLVTFELIELWRGTALKWFGIHSFLLCERKLVDDRQEDEQLSQWLFAPDGKMHGRTTERRTQICSFQFHHFRFVQEIHQNYARTFSSNVIYLSNLSIKSNVCIFE